MLLMRYTCFEELVAITRKKLKMKILNHSNQIIFLNEIY